MFINYQITPPEKLVESIRENLTHAKWIKIDELDCQKSFMRKDTTKTAEDILKLIPEAKFIHFAARDFSSTCPVMEYCLNVQVGSVGYFIWWRYEDVY